MNWEALGAIGEVIAAIAVIVTLGYLALQIRQNTREVRLATFQATTDRQHQWLAELVREPELMRVYSVGLADPSSLNENERGRFDGMILMLLRNWEDVFLHHRRGLVEDEVWTARYAAIKIWASEPGIKWSWKRRRRLFTPSFQEFFDREVDMLSANDPSRIGSS